MAVLPDKHHRGSRSLSETLEHLARCEPERVYALIPRGREISHGFRDVTVRELIHAIDACAWWISDSFGRSDDFETLAYVGVADLRYVLFFYAAIKCGYKSFFISPRSGIEQTASMLKQTSCTKFFCSSELSSKVLELQSQMDNLRVEKLAPFDDWLARYDTPFPYYRTFEDSKWDPIVVLHSSGSTGPAKPITLNFGYFAIVDRPLPRIPGRESPFHEIYDFESDGRFYSPSPAFHLSGVLSMCVYPVYSTTASVVLGLPDRPPTGESTKQIMDHVRLKLLYALPMLIEQVARVPGGMERLKELTYLTYTGGPLPKWIGDALTHDVQICTFYGSTEAGGAPLLLANREDWAYMEFHPCLEATLEPVVGRLFELVLKDSASADAYKGNVWTFPDLQEWRTRDLFEGHLSKPGLWRYYGRCDDIITLFDGKKLDPIPIESAVLAHPKVSGVIIVGEGRRVPMMLIEPSDPVTSERDLIMEIWAAVQKIDAASVNCSGLTLVQPGGLVRAPKGTVVRKLTGEKFRTLIEELYANDNRTAATNGRAK